MEVLNHERQGLKEVGPLTTSPVSLGLVRLSRFARARASIGRAAEPAIGYHGTMRRVPTLPASGVPALAGG